MGIFKLFKKSKEVDKGPKLTKEQLIVKAETIRQHKVRIANLSSELEGLFLELKEVESNFDTPRNLKSKNSDRIIRRMTFINYEIDAREGLVKWLS